MQNQEVKNFKEAMKAHNNKTFVHKNVITILFNDGTRLMARRSNRFVRLRAGLHYWHNNQKYYFEKLTLAINGLNYYFFNLPDGKKLAVKKKALHGKVMPVYDIPYDTSADKLWILPITLFNYASINS